MAEQEKRLSNIERYNRSLTPQQRLDHNKKAGQASGRARRKYRDMRETLQLLMAQNIDDEEAACTLEALGLAPSVANAVGLSVVKRAVKGEVTAVRFLRDTLEENGGAREQEIPVRAMDLSGLTDRQLEALADREEAADG